MQFHVLCEVIWVKKVKNHIFFNIFKGDLFCKKLCLHHEIIKSSRRLKVECTFVVSWLALHVFFGLVLLVAYKQYCSRACIAGQGLVSGLLLLSNRLVLISSS